jgi:hypothetical protein
MVYDWEVGDFCNLGLGIWGTGKGNLENFVLIYKVARAAGIFLERSRGGFKAGEFRELRSHIQGGPPARDFLV